MSAPMFSPWACEPDLDGDAIEPSDGGRDRGGCVARRAARRDAGADRGGCARMVRVMEAREMTAKDIGEAEAIAKVSAGGSFPTALVVLARLVLRLAPLAREALTLRRDLARARIALGWPAFAAPSQPPALISPRLTCGCAAPVPVEGASACGDCGFPLRGTTGAVEAHAEAQRASGK